MQEHLAKPHPRRGDRRPILKHPLPKPEAPHAKAFQKCPSCDVQVRTDHLDKHLAVHHAQPTSGLPTFPATVVLPKKVLPHCPECGRGIAEDHLKRHIEIFHSYQQPVLQQGALPVRKSRLARVLRECPKCGVQVREDRLEKHLARTHPPVVPTNEILRLGPESGVSARDAVGRENRSKPGADLRGNRPTTTTKAPVMPAAMGLLQCKECGHLVRPDRMRGHLSRAHPPRPVEMMIEAMRPLTLCPKCGAKVREDCMGLHFLSCHPPADDVRSFQVGAQYLPFVLLPPGTTDIGRVIEHYRKMAKNVGGGFEGRRVDSTRLEKLQSLGPIRCYVGKDSWLGYVVFEFSRSGCVVLECAIEGNATYVLFGDWKRMISHTKAEIRRRFADSYTRIVHRGEWLSRLRATLHVSRSRRA
jgi:hypothetical protein